MDLHDDLGAELSSLLLLTRMERERPGSGGLERVERMAGQLTDKVKEVIWTTDPGLDTLEATLTFIQRQVITLCTRHGLRVRTTIPRELPRIEIPAGMRRELYLIAKEALNNTIKHAGATAFMFIATLENGMLELVLADDGQGGASAGDDQGGRGLKNMHGRAEELDATLTITDVRPHGTRVTLRVAVPEPHPNE
jgi:signal transduction histidine kinase